MADLENRVSNLETKFEMFMGEMRDFKNEMRDRDNRRAAEIAELRKKQEADMKEMRQKQETDMKEIRSSIEKMNDKIDGMGKHSRNLTIAAIIGIVTISVTVIGFVISVVAK